MGSHRLFVSGGTGYLGSRLIPRLVDRGHHVTALMRQSSTATQPRGCHSIIGNPLDAATFAESIRSHDTFVQLVGVPKPAPWKGPQFRSIDLVSGLASIEAATQAHVAHFIYVSVAQPAPIMKDYLAVRQQCEDRLRVSGLRATMLRPWYIVGPSHWWPLGLQPVYWIMERIPSTNESATRLGLVTLEQMLKTLVWAVEHPPESIRVIDVPEIRRIGASTS